MRNDLIYYVTLGGYTWHRNVSYLVDLDRNAKEVTYPLLGTISAMFSIVDQLDIIPVSSKKGKVRYFRALPWLPTTPKIDTASSSSSTVSHSGYESCVLPFPSSFAAHFIQGPNEKQTFAQGGGG